MTQWIVRIENEFVVDADTEEDAKRQALHDMAFGNASVAEVIVTDVRRVA